MSLFHVYRIPPETDDEELRRHLQLDDGDGLIRHDAEALVVLDHDNRKRLPVLNPAKPPAVSGRVELNRCVHQHVVKGD